MTLASYVCHFFLKKTLRCDPKVELDHIQSGVFDLPCDDPLLVTSRISKNCLYINVTLLSLVEILNQVIFITMKNVKCKNGNWIRHVRISSCSCYNLEESSRFSNLFISFRKRYVFTKIYGNNCKLKTRFFLRWMLLVVMIEGSAFCVNDLQICRWRLLKQNRK